MVTGNSKMFYAKKLCGTLLPIILVAAFSKSAQAEQNYRFTIGALSDDFLGRTETYGVTAFDGAYFSGLHTFGDARLSYTLGDTFENDAVDPGLVFFDASYRFGNGNWRVGVGKEERHWGPSRYSSLILSRNAPAFPAIYIEKENATQPDSRLLSWIGPWTGEFFIGTTDDVGQPTDALFMGMRLSIEPAPGLNIDFLRTAQFGGAGRPSGFGTFADVLFGQTNEGPTAIANQMAGVGVSYDFNPDGNGLRVYGQTIGEDEAGNLPSCRFIIIGTEARTSLFGAPSILTLEHVDTTATENDSGSCAPGSAYGAGGTEYIYRNEGVVIGAAIGSESRSTVLRGEHALDRWALDWSVGHYVINNVNLPNHSLSTLRQDGAAASVGARFDFAGGTVRGILAYQDFDLDTAGQESGARIGISYSRSF